MKCAIDGHWRCCWLLDARWPPRRKTKTALLHTSRLCSRRASWTGAIPSVVTRHGTERSPFAGSRTRRTPAAKRCFRRCPRRVGRCEGRVKRRRAGRGPRCSGEQRTRARIPASLRRKHRTRPTNGPTPESSRALPPLGKTTECSESARERPDAPAGGGQAQQEETPGDGRRLGDMPGAFSRPLSRVMQVMAVLALLV